MSAIIAMMAMACGNSSSTEGSEGTESAETETATAAEEDNDLKIYVFNAGEILVKEISLFNPGVDVGQTKQFTNTAFLIRHPKGDLMWDTGLADELSFLDGGNDNPNFTMKVPVMLRTQMEELGVTTEEIEYLAMSHYHGDHIGNANLFMSSKLLLQQEEYDSLFNRSTSTPLVDSLINNPYEKLNGDYDVFGDSTVIIKRAPGHTPGHQVLYVDLPVTGPIVLSGDLYHFTKNRELKGVPGFNTDKEGTLQSMDAIEAFIKEKNATLWIQHDAEQMATIPHAPEYVK